MGDIIIAVLMLRFESIDTAVEKLADTGVRCVLCTEGPGSGRCRKRSRKGRRSSSLHPVE